MQPPGQLAAAPLLDPCDRACNLIVRLYRQRMPNATSSSDASQVACSSSHRAYAPTGVGHTIIANCTSNLIGLFPSGAHMTSFRCEQNENMESSQRSTFASPAPLTRDVRLAFEADYALAGSAVAALAVPVY